MASNVSIGNEDHTNSNENTISNFSTALTDVTSNHVSPSQIIINETQIENSINNTTNNCNLNDIIVENETVNMDEPNNNNIDAEKIAADNSNNNNTNSNINQKKVGIELLINRINSIFLLIVVPIFMLICIVLRINFQSIVYLLLLFLLPFLYPINRLTISRKI